MKPPRSPMLHRCSSRPGIVAPSLSVKPGASAELMSSYAPTAMSMRVTGRRDQKLAPRIECSDVIFSSTAGSGSVIRSGSTICGEMIELRQHRRHIVGENEHQIVVLHLRQRVRQSLGFVVDDLDLRISHSVFLEPFDDQPRNLARLTSSAILVLTDDDAIELRRQTSYRAQVFVPPIARGGNDSDPAGCVEVV